jgi:hypothetical protein
VPILNDGFNYGYKNENGTFIGGIGSILNRRADIIFTSKLV